MQKSAQNGPSLGLFEPRKRSLMVTLNRHCEPRHQCTKVPPHPLLVTGGQKGTQVQRVERFSDKLHLKINCIVSTIVRDNYQQNYFAIF